MRAYRQTTTCTRITARNFLRAARHAVVSGKFLVSGNAIVSMAMNEPPSVFAALVSMASIREWRPTISALRASYEPIFFVCRGNSMIKTYSAEGRRGRSRVVLLQGCNSFNRTSNAFDWRFRLPHARRFRRKPKLHARHDVS